VIGENYIMRSLAICTVHPILRGYENEKNAMGGGEHVARMGEGRWVYRVLLGKPERKRPLGRPRLKWQDNIKIGLQEVGFGGMDWTEQAHDMDSWRALVNAVMILRVP
jgi:hypothetical protein